ncbi:Archaeal Glu-tRNAGln amidotransferase subunit E (contains GAD domain) [Gloeomargarita lithophora Alchichica-D10]|uniref:Archaeal Glu-tRNAGln amidotransferase subunit E (Contains GAD domain) n=1 Tax=Gloeomargarita lithophora Alchichica-D10 TaxID=1188229 RepID=A0A1J0A9R7_9CYAN|nr:hypothetical protein [Gloeomargarita lithophora]APB32682.1 Archaeal Glu-tRNAGln amidotransferase subunit E (contains GAD domain) [Gloeomargarita lithophora Alchichica-D10]
MPFDAILHSHNRDTVTVGDLIPVYFPGTHSGILLANGGMAYCCAFDGIEGLFRKDQDATRRYGRQVCDLVKEVFGCDGFFTSDELPRYGITRAEVRALYAAMHKQPGDGVLIAVFAYDARLAAHIRSFLEAYFAAEWGIGGLSLPFGEVELMETFGVEENVCDFQS